MRRDAVEVVGGEHDGRTGAVEVVEQVQDVVAGGGVDTRRRLVHHEELWIAHQGPGHEDALLLAT